MKAFIINLLVVFVIKVIDNILGTGKTILIQKNKAFIAIATVIFIGQILIVQFGGNVFRTEPLSLTTWLYIVGTTSLVTIIPEIFRTTKKLVK